MVPSRILKSQKLNKNKGVRATRKIQRDGTHHSWEELGGTKRKGKKSIKEREAKQNNMKKREGGKEAETTG